MQHDQRSAVVAKQSGLGPLPPLPLRITPAMPLVRAGSGRAISQAGEPGQIIFAYQSEGHLATHGSEPTADSNGDSNSRRSYDGAAASSTWPTHYRRVLPSWHQHPTIATSGNLQT